MYFSPVLGRASLIGSQTQGISVLHNRVGRHRRTDRETLSVRRKEKPLSGIQHLVTRHLRLRLLRRTITSTTSKRDLIIMIV